MCCAVLCTQSCLTLCNPMHCSPPGSSVQGDSPGKNTEMGCHTLLQGIFPTQGWNPGLSHCRQILYHLSHQGSPRILEWVGYPFSRGSSQPRNWTEVSCIVGGIFTSWAPREALNIMLLCIKRKENNEMLQGENNEKNLITTVIMKENLLDKEFKRLVEFSKGNVEVCPQPIN